jgi:hypothetical protein
MSVARVVLAAYAFDATGLTAAEVLGRQLRSALLGLLLAAAVVSFALGRRTDATVIGLILAVSVGLGFANVRCRWVQWWTASQVIRRGWICATTRFSYRCWAGG